MDALPILCSVALAITCVVAITFFVNAWRIGKFDVSTEPQDCSRVLLSVIIPARNEEADIEQTLRSVLQQQGVRLEVIVVNDHSEDRTGMIADGIAAEDDRVTVIHDPALAPGWLGKANAMESARRRAKGDYIILTDADIMHHPRCFSSAVAHVEEYELDFFSLFPRFLCEPFWENVFLPSGIVTAGMLFWTPPEKSAKSNRGSGAGAFILVRADVLARIGGFESIKGEMLDDVALARRIQAAGCRVDYRLGPTVVQVRMFKDNQHAFWGITKNILGGVDNVWMAVPAILLPFVVFWTPLIGVCVGIAQGNVVLVGVGIAAIALQLIMYAVVRQFCRFHWYKAIFYPLVAIQCAACFSVALYHRFTKQAVLWRGRAISTRDSTA